MNEGQTPYQRWYEKNKQALADKRKARYNSDPEYRQKVLAESKRYRHERGSKPPKVSIPEAYSYSFGEAAAAVGIDPSTLREWMGKDYFPTPAMFGGAYRFTDEQINYLTQIKKYFDENGSRVGAKQDGFADLVALILVNWS